MHTERIQGKLFRRKNICLVYWDWGLSKVKKRP